MTSEYDILCDEGEAYASNILAASDDTFCIRILGTVHEIMILELEEIPKYRFSIHVISDSLKDKTK